MLLSPSSKERPLVQLASWISDFWSELLSALASIVLAGLGIWVSVQSQGLHFFFTPVGVLVVLAIIVGVIGAIGSLRKSQGIGGLQEKVAILEDSLAEAQRDLSEQIRDQLSLLARYALGYTDRERISVYSHNGRAFVMLGRYSENPEFDKPGRGIYPDSEGCISAAWQNGKAHFDNLPDPVIDEAAYNSAMRSQFNMNPATMHQVRMKSRSFAAFAIYDSADRHRIAVIVFESTRTARLST